jgi:hypothetical protein
MNRTELLEFHTNICGEARSLMQKKNHDYAGAQGDSPFANFEAAEKLGLCPTEIGMLIRMLDKFKRIITFAQAGKLVVTNEGFTDACIDLINYSILFAAYAQGKETKCTKE